MSKNRFPKSIRKFIREEKAKIRRQILNYGKQKELIEILYKRFAPLSPSRAVEQNKSLPASIKKQSVKK